jgi:subtilisin family serine protease
MRRTQRRPLRRWIAVVAVAAGVWYCARSDDADRGGPAVDVTIHLKLAPGIDDVQGLGADATPLFERPEAELLVDRVVATLETGRPAPDLTRWRRVRMRGTMRQIDAAVARLIAGPDVVTAFVAPVPEVPFVATPRTVDASCPVKTPSYQERQGYLGPAPGGIDAPAAWQLEGGRGEAVRFADVEHAWNDTHEDLPGRRIVELAPPRRKRRHREHGTAVLGEIAAVNNAIGMTGIAPRVERIVVASVAERSAAAAIDLAQAALRPGDVLLIELHAIGPRGRFLPMEYWDDVFEAIQVATARGVIVIEAAGNGAEDLDHRRYRGRLDRGSRDSGAILVGAGAPDLPGWVDRSRLDFSNYGSRVDVQGWGRMVATLDYGDLQGCDAADRKYTALFAGTSSASPVVAGAALLLESIVKTRTGRPLSPTELRALLVDTGSPQTDGPHGPARQHIGPRPDLRRALGRLEPRRD